MKFFRLGQRFNRAQPSLAQNARRFYVLVDQALDRKRPIDNGRAASVSPAARRRIGATRRRDLRGAAPVRRPGLRPCPAKGRSRERSPLLVFPLCLIAPTPAAQPCCFRPGLRSASSLRWPLSRTQDSESTELPRGRHRDLSSTSCRLTGGFERDGSHLLVAAQSIDSGSNRARVAGPHQPT